jgi:hypothetical protein
VATLSFTATCRTPQRDTLLPLPSGFSPMTESWGRSALYEASVGHSGGSMGGSSESTPIRGPVSFSKEGVLRVRLSPSPRIGLRAPRWLTQSRVGAGGVRTALRIASASTACWPMPSSRRR